MVKKHSTRSFSITLETYNCLDSLVKKCPSRFRNRSHVVEEAIKSFNKRFENEHDR